MSFKNCNFNPCTVWVGDNLEIMRGINSECVDLIYLDPPFNSNEVYEALPDSKAEGASFKDYWKLDDLKKEEHGELADKNPALYKVISASKDSHGDSMMAYLIMMGIRLIEIHRILKQTGSVYLHCDPTACHYLKLVLDSIFGKSNFRNQIVWQRNADRARGSQHPQKRLGSNHDTILFYTKTNKYLFKGVFRGLDDNEIRNKFPYEDEDGRRYNTDVPIFRSKGMGDRPGLCYEYNGVKNPNPSGWRFSKEKLIEMDRNGEIIWREGKNPLRKSYLDKYKGKPIGDIWTDIPNLTGGEEYIGYPTQKPLKLLDRIIASSSEEEDMIFDPFCGCATSMVSANNLNRNWIGCDLSELAVTLVKERIDNKRGTFKGMFDSGDVITVKIKENPLRRSDILSDQISPEISNKRLLYAIQEGYCCGCHHHFPYRNLTIDHIIARKRGGQDNIENLQLMCAACNGSKHTKSMAEWLAVRNPGHYPNYNPNFNPRFPKKKEKRK